MPDASLIPTTDPESTPNRSRYAGDGQSEFVSRVSSMREREELSDLIGNIYDAAIEPSLWPSAIDRVAGFASGLTGYFVTRDLARSTADVCYGMGHNSRGQRPALGKGDDFDPIVPTVSRANVGTVISKSDITPHAEFVNTRFYQEWMRPQGLVDFAATVLEKSETKAALFGVFRHERDGLVDDEMRRKMQLVVPHLRRAVEIGRILEKKTAEAASFAEVLDSLNASIFLLDRTGRVVQANASGYALLSEGTVLRVISGKLATRGAAAEQSLQDVFTLARGVDAAAGIKDATVPLMGPEGQRYVAHLLPLASGTRPGIGMSHAAVAAVFIHKAVLDTASPMQVIAKTFKLTPMESRIFLAIVHVGGVPETAEMLGISENTVRTHLHRVYAKTEISRQADLVKLVAGYANPLVK